MPPRKAAARVIKAPKKEPLPPWGYRMDKPAVMLVGGPRNGWCYWLKDMIAQRNACAATGTRLDYRQTFAEIEHPPSHVLCQQWKWEPGYIPEPPVERTDT